jgi:hypothetical protein
LSRRLLAALAALAGLAGLGLAAAAEGPADRHAEEMLQRAIAGEEPTPEDQRLAQQLLRDWRLSERDAPSGEQRTENLLLLLAGGQRLPPPLVERACELHRDYFTREGREARQREAASGIRRRPGEVFSSEPEESSIGDWFMLTVAVLILVGGVAVSAYASHRRRPDQRAYYR